MQDAWVSLVILVIGAWSAGLMYPGAIRQAGTSRWKILLLGAVTLGLTVVCAAIFTPPNSKNSEPSVLAIITVMVAMLWSAGGFLALLVTGFSRWQELRKTSSAEPAKAWLGTKPKPSISVQPKQLDISDAQPLSSDPWLIKVAGERNAKKPTRAISQGWQLGTVEFDYEDAEGNFTQRQVIVHSVTAVYIKGECLLAGAERTFRLDRVQGDIVDFDSGELLSPKQYAARMRRK